MTAKAEATVDELEMELTGDDTELVAVAKTETSDAGTWLLATLVEKDDMGDLEGAVDTMGEGAGIVELKKDVIVGPSHENEGNGDVFRE